MPTILIILMIILIMIMINYIPAPKVGRGRVDARQIRHTKQIQYHMIYDKQSKTNTILYHNTISKNKTPEAGRGRVDALILLMHYY